MMLDAGMCSKILIVQAHPDPQPTHLCHALAQAYDEGATMAGRKVRHIVLADVDIPFLRGMKDWKKPLPPQLEPAKNDLLWAEHVVIVTPLWMGDMPALLKAFIEQLFRPGIAIDPTKKPGLNSGLMRGKSARVIMTMGMPVLFYKWFYGAPALTLLRRQILKFVGFAPVRSTCIGMVEKMPDGRYMSLMEDMRELGRRGV